MSRLKACFETLRKSKRKALIPFVTAGDPNPEITVPLMHALVEAGADVLEFGIPFSDPMAEGPVIQKACERALAHHVSLRDVLHMVTEFRSKDDSTPIVLMGYLNPIEVMGYAEFAAAAQAAGVDGVLTVDLPPEEAQGFVSELARVEIDPIFLLAPTSTDERIQKISALASGFVYYVSLKGVTGAATLDIDSVKNKLAQIRKYTDMPIGVGFGIRDAQTAATIAQLADAVVVGSALVKIIGDNAGQAEHIVPEVTALLAEMRAAMDKDCASDAA